jgi:hypothetical protein
VDFLHWRDLPAGPQDLTQASASDFDNGPTINAAGIVKICLEWFSVGGLYDPSAHGGANYTCETELIDVGAEAEELDADVDDLFIPDGGGVSKCYRAKQDFNAVRRGEPRFQTDPVVLTDQFESKATNVYQTNQICNPAGKNQPVDPERDDHLACYLIRDVAGQEVFKPGTRVSVATQNFGADEVRLLKARELCIPATKQLVDRDGEPLPGEDPKGSTEGEEFKCYAIQSSLDPLGPVTLEDQFGLEEAMIRRPSRFCTPVGKNAPAPVVEEDPADPSTWRHLQCFDIENVVSDKDFPIHVRAEDQFGEHTWKVLSEYRFCEPAIKLGIVE